MRFAPPQKGGYYKDDGPHERPPANLDRIADAVPRNEPLHKSPTGPTRRSARGSCR